MESTSWLRQTPEKPLFPDLLWSRPENKRQAGKLLIIGGNSYGFANIVAAHSAARAAGVGSVQVILPASLQKTLGKNFAEAEFAPATKSGSFARLALDSWLDSASKADGILLAGDFGKNSETAILLESFVGKYEGQINIAGDSVDYFLDKPEPLFVRSNFFITSDMERLQKLAKGSVALKQNADLSQMVKQLAEFSTQIKPAIISHHENQIITAFEGRVSTTKVDKVSEVVLAAYVSVWLSQQPQKVFEALTCAAYDLAKPT